MSDVRKRVPFRRILVGTSSPIGFYYKLAPEFGYPAPIIEFPLGLFLLYEEIWFLAPQLVPYNMRGLPYVHIASEEYDLRLPADFAQHQGIGKQSIFEAGWDAAVPDFYKKDLYYDNHSHGIRLGEFGTFCSPGKKDCLELDLFVAGLIYADLLHNTINEKLLASLRSEITEHQAVEQLLIQNSQSLHSTHGPYNPVLDDLRKDPRRRPFLERLRLQASGGSPGQVVAQDLLHDYEATLLDFYKKHDTDRELVRDSVKGIISIIPGFDQVTKFDDAVQLWKKAAEARKDRPDRAWIGYVGDARRSFDAI